MKMGLNNAYGFQNSQIPKGSQIGPYFSILALFGGTNLL